MKRHNQNFNFLILIFSILASVQCSKILFVFPSPSPSHAVIGQSLAKGLVESGHEVTIVSSFGLKKPLNNYRDIIVPLAPGHKGIVTDLLKNANNKFNPISIASNLLNMTEDSSLSVLNSPDFQKIMKEESFDVFILGHFLNTYLLGIGAHFKCPIIVLSPVRATRLLDELVGNPSSVSFVSHMFLNKPGPLNFIDRVKNFMATTVDNLSGIYFEYRFEKIYNKYFPQTHYPSYDEIKKNVSLALANSHFSEGHPRPNVPALVEIGPIQVKSEPSPLPAEIEEWISASKDGAIFFSLGSNVQSKDMPPEKCKIFLNSFGKLKQNVLWKFEDDKLTDLPKNVKIWKWLPQDDILAHPNLKFFITHGGKGSILESRSHGVPIIGLPIFGDQIANIAAAEAEGWALSVKYSGLTEKDLDDAIQEILTNSKYAQTIKYQSSLNNDRPQSAMDTAIFWIEYVIRHKGAKHMQSNSVHLNTFQLYSMDVIGFLLVILLIVVLINLWIFGFVLRKIKSLFVSKKNKKD